MKFTEKKKPVHTIPQGVWESSGNHCEEKKSKKERYNEITTDAQGNGYPVSNSSRESKDKTEKPAR